MQTRRFEIDEMGDKKMLYVRRMQTEHRSRLTIVCRLVAAEACARCGHSKCEFGRFGAEHLRAEIKIGL